MKKKPLTIETNIEQEEVKQEPKSTKNKKKKNKKKKKNGAAEAEAENENGAEDQVNEERLESVNVETVRESELPKKDGPNLELEESLKNPYEMMKEKKDELAFDEKEE